MTRLKHCPYCDKELKKEDWSICSECGFDFNTLKIKCKSCKTYYHLEERTCPSCNLTSHIQFLSPFDIANVLKIIRFRRAIILTSFLDSIYLILSLFIFEHFSFDTFTGVLFFLSISKTLLYYLVKIKPVSTFVLSIILTIPIIISLFETIYSNIEFLIFIPLYILLLREFSLAYEASWNIKKNLDLLKRFL